MPWRDLGRIICLQGKTKVPRAARQHFADHHRPHQACITGGVQTFRRTRTLSGIDHPKSSIETAFFHTWYIDLGERCLPVIVLENIKARASNHSRGIEMGIERENPLMQGACSPF